MKKSEEDQIIKNALKIGQKYLDNFRPDGNPDKEKIRQELCKRTFEGEPVYALVVDSPDEVMGAIREGAYHLYYTEYKSNGDTDRKAKKKAKESTEKIMRELRPHDCIWDYYMMAFYHAAYSQCPDQSHEFGRQDFFEAFCAGLGFYINLGSLGIGVCLPEAHTDDQNRIHRENGPAIVWGKTKQYFWHGTDVPREWIEDKDNVDPSLALTHQNIEQRRALCEILGWDRVLKQVKCKSISKDAFGELIECDLPDSPRSRFVRVRCATGRDFCLPVPAEMNTAHQAVAWTYGLDDPEDYAPEIRT